MASCERRVAFETLRPLCVQLTREHTRKNVTAVSTALDKVNNRIILQELQEYLIFPVRILLKTQKDYSEDLYTDAFSLLEKILRETRIGSWDLFMDLFTTACVMIGSPSPTKDHGKVCSEELKFAIVKTLNLMVNRCDYAILQKLFSLQSLPMLGHAISIMLNLAENERARHLKIAAMNGIVGLSQVDGEYCSKVKAMLGDTFASFLPGISITLIRVITGDSKQGHSVLITAISTLMKVVHLVMNTEWIEESQTRRKLFPSPINSCSDDKLKSLAVVRDETWVKATDEKLAVLVKQITKVRGHSSWKVRTALLDFAGTLVEHMKSLPSCLPHLLEIMVGLLTDEYPNIAMASSRYLEVFSRSHMTTECRPLVEMLEENLHNLSMTLPRQMRSVDEDQKYSAVSLLSGYISLLGPHLHSVLRTSCHLRRLSLALVQILELDCTDISVIQERTMSVGHGSELISINGSKDVLKPRKNFKHFHDRRIHLELQKVCRLLGFYGDITLLIDHFLDIFHETILHKMQATLVINELVLGAAGIGVTVQQKDKDFDALKKRKVEELEGIVKMLLEEYTATTNMDLLTGPSSVHSASSVAENRLVALNFVTSTETAPSVSSFNHNIMQICLYLEGIGMFSKAIQKKFLPHLIVTLYPLMEKLGDQNAYISSTAYLALMDICVACQFRSLNELIQKNSDYLVNAISLRLRHFHSNKRSPLVLKVILEYSSADILSLVDDTVQEVLSCLDDFYEEQSSLFMTVLNELVRAVCRWFPPPKTKSKEDAGSTLTSEDSLSSLISEYYKQKKISHGEVTEEDTADLSQENFRNEEDEENPGDDDIEPDKKKNLPKHVEAVKQVLERSKHLLSSSSPRLRLLVLETISLSCQALQTQQDELLPMVHQIWNPFVCRFTDEEKLVTKKAVETLCTMANTSGDFIRHRTCKDAFPKLMSFLSKQAQISIGSSKPYLYTVNCKLQVCILSSVGRLCKKLQLSGADLLRISNTCVIYLSARQPSPLQKAAMETCKILIEIDPDPMWLLLSNLYNPCLYQQQHQEFMEVKFADNSYVRNEFTDNVMILLELPYMKSCHLSG